MIVDNLQYFLSTIMTNHHGNLSWDASPRTCSTPPAADPAPAWRSRFTGSDGDRAERIAEGSTDDDGRSDAPLLEGDAFTAGEYEIRFAVGDYLTRTGQRDAGDDAPAFLGTVVIRFGVASPDEHYHVAPCSSLPFAYSTYRGS